MEVNRTEPSPSVRLPWTDRQVLQTRDRQVLFHCLLRCQIFGAFSAKMFERKFFRWFFRTFCSNLSERTGSSNFDRTKRSKDFRVEPSAGYHNKLTSAATPTLRKRRNVVTVRRWFLRAENLGSLSTKQSLWQVSKLNNFLDVIVK